MDCLAGEGVQLLARRTALLAVRLLHLPHKAAGVEQPLLLSDCTRQRPTALESKGPLSLVECLRSQTAGRLLSRWTFHQRAKADTVGATTNLPTPRTDTTSHGRAPGAVCLHTPLRNGLGRDDRQPGRLLVLPTLARAAHVQH